MADDDKKIQQATEEAKAESDSAKADHQVLLTSITLLFPSGKLR